VRPVSTAAQMRALDGAVIDGLGLPGVALMELASRGVAEFVREVVPRDARILVTCGPGNNGGDGWAVARWLHGWGRDVAVWSLGEPTTGDAAIMADVARAAGVAVVDAPGRPDWVIDALFGTGLTRPVEGRAAEVLRQLWGVPTVAVDVPSGLQSDTGELLGASVQARHTVTFGREKVGMYLLNGPRACGEVHTVDIGLSAGTPDEELAEAWVMEASDLVAPRRPWNTHKRRMGDLLVVAGSAAMAGAAVLACEGALAAGVGLLRLVAPRGALPRLGRLPPEVMVVDGGPGDVLSALPDVGELERTDGIVAGPGLGGGQPLPPAVSATLRRWWQEASVPVLFDADALVATGPVGPELADRRVLTPHEGEATRLLGADASLDRLGAVRRLGERGTALLKGPHTLVADRGRVTINPTGHPVLATGGSGDVMAGFIGGLMARGLSGPDAARAGAWHHGAAGERLAAQREEGWSASDLPGALRRRATSRGT